MGKDQLVERRLEIYRCQLPSKEGGEEGVTGMEVCGKREISIAKWSRKGQLNRGIRGAGMCKTSNGVEAVVGTRGDESPIMDRSKG